jgi:hypothetical protein
MQLRANGHEVYGFGERKTPEPFVNACSTFLYLDSLGEEAAAPTSAAAAAAPSREEPSPAPKPAAKPAAPSSRSLAQDAKLVAVLRGAVEATAGDDGWANLSAAGSAAKRQAPIDPRNYGARNFPKLFEATGLFEIIRAEGNGQTYVADKRNKDRAPAPAGGGSGGSPPGRGDTLLDRLPAAIGPSVRS